MQAQFVTVKILCTQEVERPRRNAIEQHDSSASLDTKASQSSFFVVFYPRYPKRVF